MGRFAKVEEVAPTQRGVPWKTGNYRVALAACKVVDGQEGDVYYIIEGTCLETDNDEVKVGEKRSQVINTTNKKARDAPFRDMKAFLCAALGVIGDDHECITEEAIEYSALNNEEMPGGPLEHLELDLQVNERPATKDKGAFTYHRWYNADEGPAKQLQDHFAELGLLK